MEEIGILSFIQEMYPFTPMMTSVCLRVVNLPIIFTKHIFVSLAKLC